MDELPPIAAIRGIDAALAAEGVAVRERPDRAMADWLRSTTSEITQLSEIAAWFSRQFAELHPSVDFTPRPFAYLCASAQGVCYVLSPPVIYGAAAIDPIRSVRISHPELERIWNAHPEVFWELYYQAADGIDLFLSDLDFHPSKPEAGTMLAVATGQLEASARQLVAGSSDASLSQACCLAAELALKAVLTELGATRAELKAWEHNISVLANQVVARLPSPNDPEFIDIAGSMPNYVAVRYNPPQLSVSQAHNLFRRALFVCAEAMRRTRHDQLYYKLLTDSAVPSRNWQP